MRNTGMGRETLPQHKIEGETQLQMLSSDLHAPSGASVCVCLCSHTQCESLKKKWIPCIWLAKYDILAQQATKEANMGPTDYTRKR